MSYRADVRAIISAKRGGSDFLTRMDKGYQTTPEELLSFFTEKEQDELFKLDQTRNIDQAIAEGMEGDRIIERVGQIHYGGPNSKIDGNASDVHGRLTLKTYGHKLLKTYKEELAK
ncbi:MAG: hypothetical protein F6K65_42570 [Moorea sp. SIO3C2]|nr:hypothetical protein [Moorena sp. SIO3C2]